MEQGVVNDVLAIKMNAESLQFAEESFDTVFGIGSFFMIENRKEAMKEMSRVTRKAGRIGIAEPMCTTNSIPDELKKYELLGSYKKWLRSLEWNCKLFYGHGLRVFESFYFS